MMTLDSPQSLGVIGILREAVDIPCRSWKLMVLITLLALVPMTVVPDYRPYPHSVDHGHDIKDGPHAHRRPKWPTCQGDRRRGPQRKLTCHLLEHNLPNRILHFDAIFIHCCSSLISHGLHQEALDTQGVDCQDKKVLEENHDHLVIRMFHLHCLWFYHWGLHWCPHFVRPGCASSCGDRLADTY